MMKIIENEQVNFCKKLIFILKTLYSTLFKIGRDCGKTNS